MKNLQSSSTVKICKVDKLLNNYLKQRLETEDGKGLSKVFCNFFLFSHFFSPFFFSFVLVKKNRLETLRFSHRRSQVGSVSSSATGGGGGSEAGSFGLSRAGLGALFFGKLFCFVWKIFFGLMQMDFDYFCNKKSRRWCKKKYFETKAANLCWVWVGWKFSADCYHIQQFCAQINKSFDVLLRSMLATLLFKEWGVFKIFRICLTFCTTLAFRMVWGWSWVETQRKGINPCPANFREPERLQTPKIQAESKKATIKAFKRTPSS